MKVRRLVLLYITSAVTGAAVSLALVGLASDTVEAATVAGLMVAWILGDQARRLS